MKFVRLSKQDEMNSVPAVARKRRTTTKEVDKYEQAKKDALPTNIFLQRNSVLTEQAKNDALPAKIFLQRNSVLTDLMALNHLKSIHNMIIASFVMLFMVTTAYYIATPEQYFHDISAIGRGASKLKWFFIIWISLHISCICGVLPAFSIWITVRSKFHKKLTDIMFLVAYIIYLILAILVPAYLLLVNKVPIITTIVTQGEQLRLWMKIYSFVRENVPKVLNEDLQKDGMKDKHFRPNLRNFVYFLFVPTLIYRESYPKRTERSVRWSFVLSHLFQLWCCVFVIYCSVTRFTMVNFRKACLKEFLPSELVLIYTGCIVVGSLKLLLVFYLLLHCWQNAFAEMLRFGDREFYQDWWNSTSFSQYYRKWNIVVSDWLYAYIFVDIYKLTGNRVLSLIAVFHVSAIFHEYIFALSLRFFYPVLGTIYSTAGVMFMFLTHKRRSQLINIFLWASLFAGMGILEFFYSFEWFARENTPRLSDELLDFFVPRTLSCKIIASQPT